MDKIRNEQNLKNELWFDWLTRKFHSYEAFKDFASGKNPEDVAENFLSSNKIAISEVIDKFDDEDKDILDQFQKLTECEWHVFRILKNHLNSKNKVKFVNFKK
tara:strand:- start:249 stop:557 length:309 start_codon:yes stop_codon:yes gene_type:complete